MALMYCRDCKIEVDTAVNKRCPQCNQSENGLFYAEDSVLVEHPMDNLSRGSTSSRTIDLAEDPSFAELVEAQNRTTHAVRALAISFVAAPVVSLVALLVIALAIKSGNSTMMAAAGIGGLIAFLIMLFMSLRELSRSKIERRRNSRK